jgi:hypothetical protein
MLKTAPTKLLCFEPALLLTTDLPFIFPLVWDEPLAALSEPFDSAMAASAVGWRSC